ncbi:hypothetical protein FSP39_018541 [Pinctada imbricata]|uniref:Methyltransferase domain-containing protein n=1 Tax=Pinctada imbricata TaxID=66713 RepID=A0AA88XQ26_PINIB|nr:hypothetical protein FSP39_018541 [Pinctada imbricata]
MEEKDRKGSLPTATDGHATFDFDGVFRDVNNSDTRSKLYASQKLITENKWEEAKEKLRSIIKDLEEGHDRRNISLVMKEVELYQRRHIDPSVTPAEGIDWAAVCSRTPEMYFERYDELPQSVFTLGAWGSREGQGRTLVGRRILSHQWIASKIRELHCSHIRASMLLGLMIGHRVQDDGYLVYYRPLTAAEKKYIMHDIVHNRIKEMEIIFPYPALQTAFKTEIHCPDEGWEIDETLALQLGEGEVFLRDYSVDFLKSMRKDDLILYDPACSTGQFLWTMKQALPNSYTVGQDLSEQMVQFATKRVDEIHCGNAIEPKIAAETADVVFVRFINSEVLKTKDARSMVHPLLQSLKRGGSVVIFGHTPVLVSAADLLMDSGLQIDRCIGGDPKWDGIFQYYVCHKV